LFYSRIEEYWDPILSGLDPIVVSRQVPAIHILLSQDEIDPKTTGYQKSSLSTSFWADHPGTPPRQSKKSEDYVYRNRNQRNAINKSQQNRPRKNQNGQTVSSSIGNHKKRPNDGGPPQPASSQT
jgi:ribonuclease P/MRP protein subunit RPP25